MYNYTRVAAVEHCINTTQELQGEQAEGYIDFVEQSQSVSQCSLLEQPEPHTSEPGGWKNAEARIYHTCTIPANSHLFDTCSEYTPIRRRGNKPLE